MAIRLPLGLGWKACLLQVGDPRKPGDLRTLFHKYLLQKKGQGRLVVRAMERTRITEVSVTVRKKCLRIHRAMDAGAPTCCIISAFDMDIVLPPEEFILACVAVN